MKKIVFILLSNSSLIYSMEAINCSEYVTEDALPNYVKKIELLNEKTLKIIYKEWSPLSWYGDWSKSKEQIIELGNSYIFESNMDDKDIGYSVEYKFEKICEDKAIIKQETNINKNIVTEIKYFAVAVNKKSKGTRLENK